MEFVHELTQHQSMKDFYGAPLRPAPAEDRAAFAVAQHDSYHHGVGTCAMGAESDPAAVVDQRLRVHGMDNLWVADASVMPTITRASTNLTAVLIGERVSDVVQQTA
jgi:choline dehydrogenase